MKFLNKLPNSVRSAPGLERTVLRLLPGTLLAGTLVPYIISQATRFFPPEGTANQIAKHITSVDIMAIAIVVTVWMAVLTVAIGCIVVVVMKGHAYVADAYELVDSERPWKR